MMVKMTNEQTTPIYAALLTLTLPGEGPSATVTVTLAPADIVPVEGRRKPLAECTLAELRAYANELEADAWDAYKAITLHQLQEEGQVDIVLRPLDAGGEAGEEVEDWLRRSIILPPAPAEETALADAPASAAPTAEPEPAPPAEPDQAAAPAPQPEPPPQPLAAQPAAGSTPPIASPAIIPSQARVRVAGGRLPLAYSSGAAVDILLDEMPLRAMQAHALSSLDREVAGVMVGRQPEKQPDGRYIVHVIDSIIAQHTVMHGASVTYTPESWRHLNDTLWERYPDESAVMVGWYHTHPGFGIFLSGMDLFIHQNFFTQIWHVAYVLDPRARTSGFFSWNRQKTKVNRYDFMWPEWAAGSW